MQKISWDVRGQRPMGYLSFLYHYTVRTDREAGLALAREAEKELLKSNGLSQQTRRCIKGELELIHGVAAFNDFAAISEKHKNAYALLGGKYSVIHRDHIWTFGCPHLAFNYLRAPGKYDAIVRLSDEFWTIFQEMSGGCAVGAQDLFHAEQLLERHSLKKVEPFIMKGVYRANAREQLASLIAGHFSQARLSLTLGNDAADALEALEELKVRVMRANNPLLLFSFDLALGYTLRRYRASRKTSLCGSGAGMRRLCRIFTKAPVLSAWCTAKTLIAGEDWPALEALAQDMPDLSGPYPTLMGRIHTKIMHAIAARNLHGDGEAKTIFAEAVKMARPDKLVLIFAEYGRQITPLLASQRNAASDAFLTSIKKAAADLRQERKKRRHGACTA
jgi:LuxR family maltose regulon positive regulatory protein